MVGNWIRLRVTFVVACAFGGASALPLRAQTPRQQLREALTALQADTARPDSALRAKIISLVQSLDPPPVVPDEVAELAGRAVYAFKSATSPADYDEAINAYKKALLVAPWVAKNYYNLGVVQEKAGKPSDAIESFRWYLMAAPNANDATEVRERIGGLKYAATKVAEERDREAAAAALESDKRETFEAFKRAVQGLRYEYLFCTPPEYGAKGQDRGCTWPEFHGNNWYTISGFANPRDIPVYFWVFHDDYALLESTLGGTPMRLKAAGKGFENLVMDWQGVQPLPDRWFPLALINWKPDFSQFTIGLAPSKDVVVENPDKRYSYEYYRAIK